MKLAETVGTLYVDGPSPAGPGYSQARLTFVDSRLGDARFGETRVKTITFPTRIALQPGAYTLADLLEMARCQTADKVAEAPAGNPQKT